MTTKSIRALHRFLLCCQSKAPLNSASHLNDNIHRQDKAGFYDLGCRMWNSIRINEKIIHIVTIVIDIVDGRMITH